MLIQELPALAKLFPPELRGTQIIMPCLEALSGSPMWTVRVDVAVALDTALQAALGPFLQCMRPGTKELEPRQQALGAAPNQLGQAVGSKAGTAGAGVEPGGSASQGGGTGAPGAGEPAGAPAGPVLGGEPGATRLANTQDEQALALCEIVVRVLCRGLALDVSHWVRTAAIRAAGPVLCMLPRWCRGQGFLYLV